jgi:hypothetical protein
MVRMKGLEPPRLSAPDPKSGAAANYATSAIFPLPERHWQIPISGWWFLRPFSCKRSANL